MSMDGWVDKENMVYTYNGMLAFKKKKILSYVTTWLNLEDTLLSEKSLSQKNKYCIIPII